MQRFERIRFGILSALLLLTILVWLPQFEVRADTEEFLTVRFLDVGQGDAVHIQTPDGFEMLVDGGPDSSVLRELAKGRSYFDKDINVVVATHPDTDHVGGLVDVLKRYEVDLIIDTAVESDSPADKAFRKAVQDEGAEIVLAQARQVFMLGASTTIEIFSPVGDTSRWPSNNASVVMKVTYGDIDFLLTGDAESGVEDYLVGAYGADLESEVLKLGHHGSKTSTSELFLDTVKPEYTVVSAGENNRYGHPHQSVMNRVFARDIESLSTVTEGTITFISDGSKVWIE